MPISKEEAWEVLKELGADDPYMYGREIEYAIKYVDSKEEMRALDELLAWESSDDSHLYLNEEVKELGKKEKRINQEDS